MQEGDAAKQPEQEVAGQPIDTWALPENTGRAYAALDGDISPMHLYKATAMLMGFPSPVANVHFLAARTEATIATTVGESCVWGPG
jgi:acyl dehydratase